MNWKSLIYCISFFIPFCAIAHSGDYAAIEFIRNQGQWDGPFEYRARFGNVNIFLEKNAFTYHIGDAANAQKLHDYKFGRTPKAPVLKYHTYKVHMLGANKNPEITGSKAQQHYYNYFIGNDPARWKSNIHPELAVDYKNIYNNIDLHIATELNSIKYDFIVRPGADASVIQLQYEGADDLRIKDDRIVITTSVGEVLEAEPYAYQYIDGQRVDVSCRYKLKGNIITYHFPKGYDHSVPLVIDPTVVFATFTGSTSDNWGFTATYDAQGNFYAGGIVDGTGYPTTIGPSYQGGDGADGNNAVIKTDMGISKFNSAGNTMVYSTYLGGSSQDQPHSMVVDNSGNLYIAGRTYSVNFPIPGNTSTHNGASDIIVAKLNNTGTLANARFVGGSQDDGVNMSSVFSTVTGLKHSYADDARSEILLDNAGNVYVAACTRSTNFPTANAVKNTLTGTQDGVVFKLSNNLSTLLWSTYIGGNREDAAYVLAFNVAQSSVYVSGGTASPDFSGSGGLWGSYQGGTADGFIIKYQNSGNYPIQRSTLIGRGNYDQCFGIQVDNENNVYVMGQTLGGTFPVTAGVYSNAGSSQFLMKLDSNLSSNIYSTVYGSGTSATTNITPVAFLVDTCQNVYISGWGGTVANNGGNTQNMPVLMGNPPPTPLGIVDSTTDGDDFYFIVFSKNASALLFAAYYGGKQTDEHVDGGTSRFNANGEVYQAICGGCGRSSQVPTTTGAYSNTNGGPNCNLIALKIAFNLGAVSAKANASPNTTICLGEPINFSSNGSNNATNYEWAFGDGNSSTSANPVHTYAQGGTYQVRMIAINPNACKVRDTTTLTIVVDTNSIKADFEVAQTDSCKPFKANFNNTSIPGKNPNNASYQWFFGDGASFNGKNPPEHEYPDTGTYKIILVMSDPGACNSPDTIEKTITFNTLFVKAQYDGPDSLCEDAKGLFLNMSDNWQTVKWDFGDGKTSAESNPEHAFDTAGTFTVTLYSYNPKTCNRVDSVSKTITVHPIPVANFRYEPLIPETNEPVNFTNLSQKATSYIWDFGDNTFSDLETPRPKYYKKTGTYRVCLQALNRIGCSDTICKYVDADVFPLADVPTGFSPNGDGNNDILYVRGAGVETVDLKIYNRWGELVFETTDMGIGWDGTYKNKEQPVEAYAYVLNVTFIDGTTYYKKGNVTLLR